MSQVNTGYFWGFLGMASVFVGVQAGQVRSGPEAVAAYCCAVAAGLEGRPKELSRRAGGRFGRDQNRGQGQGTSSTPQCTSVKGLLVSIRWFLWS